jgi:hypothetical protein
MSWPLKWQLTNHSLEQLERSPDTQKFEVKEGSIARMRNEGVRIARQAGADAILFVDGDMVFPEDALRRLLDHNVPVVGGHCLQTCDPFPATLWRQRGHGLMRCAPEGHGLMEIDGTGGAFLLVDCEVFDTLDKTCDTQGAYFRDYRDRMDLPPEQRLSEDLWFCSQVRKAGYPLYVDLDCRIGHLVVGIVEPDTENGPALKLVRGYDKCHS